MRLSVRRSHPVGLALWLGLTLASTAIAVAQETLAGRLIAQARQQIEDINPDSAAALLRQALDSRAGATIAEKLRAYVLYGVTELTAGRADGARRTFREALALEPTLRVDSLAELHEALVVTFEGERAALARPAPSVLEVRGLPAGARLVVDGVVWNDRRRQVDVGVRGVQVSARGYFTYIDSIRVDAGVTVVRDIALVRSDLARLSVTREPWGIVYLDGERVGETPIFESQVPAGTYALRVESPSAQVYEQSVELIPGRLTRLGTVGSAVAPPASLPALARADSLYRAVGFDSALVLYREVAWDTAARHGGALRAQAATRAAMALFSMAAGRKDPALADSARAYFGAAYRAEPRYEPDPDEMGPEMRAAMETARARVLGIVVTTPSDTLLPPTGGRLVITAEPTHQAVVRFRIAQGDAREGRTVHTDLQETGGEARFAWDYHLTDGSLLSPGRYTLVVEARDAQGEVSPVLGRSFRVAREAVDTLVHPPQLSADAFAPETLRVNGAPAGVLLAGAILGAGTVGLERALGNSALTGGKPTGSGSYVVAGSVTLAAVAGFLAGHRTRPVPENILRNAELRERYARDLDAVLTENVRRRENARVRFQFDEAPR